MTTPIADMIEQMLARGASTDVVVVAVRTVEVVSADVHGQSADKADAKRAADAARKRAAREEARKLKELAEANDAAKLVECPQTSMDASADTSDKRCQLTSFLPSLSSEKGTPNKQESKNKNELVALAPAASKRGTRLSAEWTPSADDRQFAIKNNVDPDRLRAEFVDFWIGVPGQRGVKLNWSATWRNRVRAIGGGKGNLQNGKDKSLLSALDRLEQKLAGGDDYPPGEDDLLSLPAR